MSTYGVSLSCLEAKTIESLSFSWTLMGRSRPYLWSLCTLLPSIILKPEDKIVTEGKLLTFQCAAAGNPSPKITWTKDGITMVEGDTLSFKTNRTQSGKYWCSAGGWCNNDCSNNSPLLWHFIKQRNYGTNNSELIPTAASTKFERSCHTERPQTCRIFNINTVIFSAAFTIL